MDNICTCCGNFRLSEVSREHLLRSGSAKEQKEKELRQEIANLQTTFARVWIVSNGEDCKGVFLSKDAAIAIVEPKNSYVFTRCALINKKQCYILDPMFHASGQLPVPEYYILDKTSVPEALLTSIKSKLNDAELRYLGLK